MHRTRRHSTKPRARTQVLRCADEILQRRSEGESFTDIHVDLLERAEIDVRLRVFTLWVSRMEEGGLSPLDDLTRGNNDSVRLKDAQRRSRVRQSERSPESKPARPSQGPRTARLGVPILPAPNSEPDCDALFGEKE